MTFDFTLADFQNLWKTQNLFNANSSQPLVFFDLLIVLFGLILVIGILIKLFYWLKFKKDLQYQRFSDKILSCHLICGFCGLGFVICNYESVVFLSMPFLIFLDILAYIGWVGYLFYYRFGIMPEKLLDYRILLRKEEYLKKRK
jgi:amino acid transporter